jgi:hypothetical protein
VVQASGARRRNVSLDCLGSPLEPPIMSRGVSVLVGLRLNGLYRLRACRLGQSGTGKTTIARLIAQDVASEWDTEEIDAGALTCAALRDPRPLHYLAHRRIVVRPLDLDNCTGE